MFLKRNEQELYKEMDKFVDDKTAIFHKMKVQKLLSGMSSKTEGSNKREQFRFLERCLGHDLLITLITFLLKARAAGSKIFSIKMPALQWKNFESYETMEGRDPEDFASVFFVPPKSEKTNPVQAKVPNRCVSKIGRKQRSQERGKYI